MKETEHYRLKKPEINDYAKIQTLNENADAIDAALRALEEGKADVSHAEQHSAQGGDPVTPKAIGALPSTGGILSGSVLIQTPDTPGPYMRFESSDGSMQQFSGGYHSASVASYNKAKDYANSRMLQVLNSARNADLKSALSFYDTVDGTATRYSVYGEHNKPDVDDVNGLSAALSNKAVHLGNLTQEIFNDATYPRPYFGTSIDLAGQPSAGQYRIIYIPYFTSAEGYSVQIAVGAVTNDGLHWRKAHGPNWQPWNDGATAADLAGKVSKNGDTMTGNLAIGNGHGQFESGLYNGFGYLKLTAANGADTTRIQIETGEGNSPYIERIVNGVKSIDPIATTANLAEKAQGKGVLNAVDLNTAIESGMYRAQDKCTNVPPGIYSYGQLLVIHGGGDTIAQIYFDYNQNRAYLRSGNPPDVGGPGAWSDWVTIATTADIAAITPGLYTTDTTPTSNGAINWTYG